MLELVKTFTVVVLKATLVFIFGPNPETRILAKAEQKEDLIFGNSIRQILEGAGGCSLGSLCSGVG